MQTQEGKRGKEQTIGREENKRKDEAGKTPKGKQETE